MIALVIGGSLVLLALLADQLRPESDWVSQALASFALFSQVNDFARGFVDTRPVILYLSLTFFFLFLTLRIVESRRWK
jgi:ABC-2 type transport system permease protein